MSESIPFSAQAAFNTPKDFVVCGRTFTVRQRTVGQEAQMSQWVEEHYPPAIETLARHAKKVAGDDATLMREIIKESFAKASEEDRYRDTRYGGKTFMEHIGDQDFVQFQLQLALGLSADELAVILAQATPEDSQTLGQVLAYFHRGATGLIEDREDLRREMKRIAQGETTPRPPDQTQPGNHSSTTI